MPSLAGEGLSLPSHKQLCNAPAGAADANREAAVDAMLKEKGYKDGSGSRIQGKRSKGMLIRKHTSLSTYILKH